MAPPAVLRFGDLSIEGWSWAGDATWFRVNPPGLAFDVGRGSPRLAGAQDIFLTHGHLDHALGLPFVLSLRNRQRLGPCRVLCPAEIAPRLAGLVAACEALEEDAYRYQVVPLAPGSRVEVGRDLAVEAFRTDHVVPSLGYHLLRSRRRLDPAYRGLAPAELAALRRRGVAVEVAEEEHLLTYCGDTGPGVFDGEPRLFSARVLLLESTFIAPEHVEHSRRYGHLHLGDVAARADRFANEHLVLYHLSRRYRKEDLEEMAAAAMPGLGPRLHVVVGGG